MHSVSDRRDAAAQLREAAGVIGTAAIAAMYAEDPFWLARFGERGRRYADEDGRRHVEYLAEAVETGSADPFAAYGRWLRTVLISRGMCTLHIHDNFSRLARVLDTAAPAVAGVVAGMARPYLDAGREALMPVAKTAAIVHVRALASPRRAAAQPFIEDEAFLLSYLADALDAGQADSLTQHLRWLDGVARGTGHGDTLDATLRRVGAATADLPDASAILAAARSDCAVD